MLSGYAFAAIKGTKDDPIPNPGPGGGGGSGGSGGGGESGEDDATYSISGQGPVYPYTPFTVTVTASDGKTAGRHGSLTGMFSDNTPLSYKTITQSNWNSGTKTYSLGVETINRSKSGVTFLWLVNGKDSPRATLAYSAGHMVPNIVPSTVKAGTQFNYTVTYSSSTGGSAISSSYGKWSNFGATIKWQGYDGTKWEDVDIVSASSPSGSSGVFSGTATCAMSMKYSKIRLCVTYAGDTLYDEASFANADALVITGADTLHRYGDADELSITGADITPDNVGSVVIKAFNVLGEEVDIDDYFEDEDGDFLDFTEGWEAQTGGGMKWIGSIRAVSDVDQYREITLKASFLGSVATHDILIVTEVGGEIGVDSSVVLHVQFPISMWIAGGVNRNLAIPRFPTESLSLNGGNDFTGSSLTWSYDASTGKCVCATQGTFTSTGTKELDLVDLLNNVYAMAEVNVVSISLALAEAINERNLAKGITTTYTGEEGATLLRSYAIAACAGYVNADGVSASGTATNYTDTGSGVIPIDAAEESIEWYQAAYEKVCEVVSRSADATRQIREKSASGHYQYESTWDPERGEYIPSGTESGAKSNAEQNFDNNKTVGDWGSGSISESLQSSYTGQDYEAWGATISAVITDFRVKANGSSPFSRQADYYYQAKRLSGSSSDSTYNNLGHHNLSLNETKKLSSANAAAQSEFGWDEHVFTLEGAWVSYRGYRLEYKSCFVTYGFKHK